jgi:hypothetical protein
VTIRVEIKRRILSANAFTNQRGPMKSFAYRKDRDAWFIMLRAALRPRPAPGKCHVRMEVHSYRNRVLDDANFRGGCKGLVDNLKTLGYLHDDAPKYFFCDYFQHQVPRIAERTVLVIHPPTSL